MKYVNYEDIVNQAVKEAMASISFEDDMVLSTNDEITLTDEITKDDDIKKKILKKEY